MAFVWCSCDWWRLRMKGERQAINRASLNEWISKLDVLCRAQISITAKERGLSEIYSTNRNFVSAVIGQRKTVIIIVVQFASWKVPVYKIICECVWLCVCVCVCVTYMMCTEWIKRGQYSHRQGAQQHERRKKTQHNESSFDESWPYRGKF